MHGIATLTIEDQTLELPYHRQSEQSSTIVLDTHTLYSHNILSFDHGFGSTAACQSAISDLDGQAGKLRYRGYAIEALGERCDYLATAYLLLEGEWPSQNALAAFRQQIIDKSALPEAIYQSMAHLPQNAHPMALLATQIASLMGQFPLTPKAWDDHDKRRDWAQSIIAWMPTLVALCYRHNQGLPLEPVRTDLVATLGYSGQFLHNLMATSSTPMTIDPALVQAMEAIFVLHADHSQNASTSGVRVCGSTGSGPLFCLLSGLGTLSGPAHGGANEACLDMLKAIGDVAQVPDYIQRAKDSEDPFRLMGFGHRVYKNYDPRAKVMQGLCHQVLKTTQKHDHPLLKIAVELERIALEDDYFIERKLYPNIDFYSGITMNAMGIPSNLFTPIFALSRSCGWMSHWLEMHQESTLRLSRPRQWYVGALPRQLPPR